MTEKQLANELLNIAKELTASQKIVKSHSNNIFLTKDDVDFVYNPFNGYLQIGMGGEWWSGNVTQGKNIFQHKKNQVDPAYQNVIVEVYVQDKKIIFDVRGGFGIGAGGQTSFSLEAK